MAKKTFKDNPALQFINTPTKEPEGSPEEPAGEVKIGAELKPPEGFKHNPLYIETKSKRVQLLMQPTLYAKIKAMADKEETSVNQLIHSILKSYTNEEGE